MNGWCDENIYLDEMARAHKLTPKLEVIHSLKEEFDRIKKDPTYKSNLTKEERQWLLVALSGQIFALSMELTDDLAFVCAAYLRSIANSDRKVVEYIASSARQDAQDFYQNVATSCDVAIEAVGLDQTKCTWVEKEKYKGLFNEIRGLRNHFWRWYNGYKHGQYATPIVVDVGTPQEKWGLYRIPRELRRLNGKVHVMGEESFIDTVTFVDEFVKLAETSVALWTEIRNRQYPKLFKRALP